MAPMFSRQDISSLWLSARQRGASLLESLPTYGGSSTALMDDISPRSTVDLDELLATHSLNLRHNSDGDPFIIAEPQGHGQQFSSALAVGEFPGFAELGSTSPSPWTSFTRQEYNQELAGQRGLRMYDKMRKSDGTVRGSLKLVKAPVLSARYFVEAGGTSTVDQTASNFMRYAIFEGMSTTWTQTLTEATLMLDFGNYMMEKVFEPRIVDGVPRIVWKKLAPRHPMDVKKWNFDRNGGPESVEMYNPFNNGGFDPVTGQWRDSITIPIEKLLVFSFDKEAGNIEGVSVLRSAYKHWYYKDQLYKIDAIQKERHGIGIPVILLPPGYKEDDKKLAEELGRNIRTNERAHIVLPPNWVVTMLKMEGHLVDCLKSAEHHDNLIRQNVLGEFLRENSGEEVVSMFLKATKFVADIIVDSFNSYAIPQLHEMNFARGKCPKLRVRRIGDQADWRTHSAALRNFVGASLITPDEPLEDQIRDEMDLPKRDPDTAREVATPQNPNDEDEDESQPGADRNRPGRPTPPRVGAPRQSQARNMQQQARGTGKRNTGRVGTGR